MDLRVAGSNPHILMDKSTEISDNIKTTDSDKIQSEMITIYGKVELSSQERKFLALGPGFPLMERLDNNQIERDFLTSLTKVRWTRTGLETSEVQRYRTEEDEAKEEEVEQIGHLHTRVFNDKTKTLDLTKKVCTDQKSNRRVFMPLARPVKEECSLKARKDAWKTEWVRCTAAETRGKGSQDHHQLDQDEISGRNSLLKRIAEGEIHVSQSDKGKRIVIMDMDMYYNMSIVHTAQDTEVDWRTLEQTQRDLRAHSRALPRIFRLGEGPSNRNRARCFDNISSWACNPPVMRCMAKTHKPVGANGVPKSRPVVGAAQGLTTAIGDLIADILEPLAKVEPEATEAQSTEELMRSIQDTNTALREVEEESVVLASMDVTSLYPSIDQEGAAVMVREAFEKSDLQVESVNYRTASLYLALTVPKEVLEAEGFGNLVPKRRTNRGRRPTVRTNLLSGPLPRDSRTDRTQAEDTEDPGDLSLEDIEWDREEDLEVGSRQDPEPARTSVDQEEAWIFPGELPPPARRKILGKVLEIAVKTTFSNHIYLFHNRLFRQGKGGPIGLRLTGVVARLVMDSWARLFLSTLDLNNIKVHLFKKYVDDVNLAMSLTRPGVAWERDPDGPWRLVWTQEREDRDLKEGTDTTTNRERTMGLMREMASTLVQGICFTVDLPARYTEGKVPMLDLQVWTERRNQGMVIRHTFYEKQVTSPLVFHNRGACPTKQKVIILAEEVKRRLYNQDKDHRVKDRLRDLTTFTQKMIDSGYGKDLRREILKAGIKRYFRLTLQEQAGGRSLYRSLREMAPQRRLKQLNTRNKY